MYHEGQRMPIVTLEMLFHALTVDSKQSMVPEMKQTTGTNSQFRIHLLTLPAAMVAARKRIIPS